MSPVQPSRSQETLGSVGTTARSLTLAPNRPTKQTHTRSKSADAATGSPEEYALQLDQGASPLVSAGVDQGRSMPRATHQATGHNLVRELSHLRNDDGMTLTQVRRAPALLDICGQTVETARETVVETLQVMNCAGGQALLHMYNVDGTGDKDYVTRRNAYVRKIGIDSDTLLKLEINAIDELALRLLHKRYGNQASATSIADKYLVSSIHVACIIRGGRVVETLQEWKVIPVVDNAQEFIYWGTQGTKLRDLHNGEVQQPVQGGSRLQHKIRFPKPLTRGREYRFSFREIVSWDGADRPPRDRHYQHLFDDPVLRYRVGVRFLGEQPVKVWSYTCAVGDHTPGPPTPETIIQKSDTGYDSVEFDQYNRISGVAWSWREPRPGYLVAGILVLAAATFNWPVLLGQTGKMVDVGSVLVFVLLLSIGLPLVYKYFFAWNRRRFKASHHYNQLIQVPERAVVGLQRPSAKRPGVTALQSAVFTTSILKPRQLRQRVSETYDLGRRTLRQRVTIEANVPSNLLPSTTEHSSKIEELLPSAYFAVLVPKKSKFHDDFSLYRADGTSLTVMSYREYLQLVASVLHLSLATAFDLQDRETRGKVEKAKFKALQLIMSRRTVNGIAPNLTEAESWWEGLAAPTELHARHAWESVLALVQLLTFHYAIVAVVEPDREGRFWLRYERTLVPDLKLGTRDKFAVLLGARPVELSISIRSACTTQSYHLHVNGPEDSYLGKQYLADSSATLESTARDYEVVPPHYRFRRRLGQPHAHFYARFFPEPAIAGDDGAKRRENPQVRVKYYETPPGSLLRAAVSAVACVLLVAIVGAVSSRNLDPGTDAAAVLLVFPALVAAWLGFDSPSRGLLEGTVASRLSLLATVVISISASGLYMAHKALTKIRIGDVETTYDWWKVPPRWSILWIYDVSWMAITAAAVVNTVIILYFYLSRTAHFAYLASRQDGSEVQQHG